MISARSIFFGDLIRYLYGIESSEPTYRYFLTVFLYHSLKVGKFEREIAKYYWLKCRYNYFSYTLWIRHHYKS